MLINNRENKEKKGQKTDLTYVQPRSTPWYNNITQNKKKKPELIVPLFTHSFPPSWSLSSIT